MKESDIRIGMKVIAHKKTTGEFSDTYEKSTELRKAKEKNQKFLYVIGKDEDLDYYILAANENNKSSGDFFNPSDFNPYLKIERKSKINKINEI